MKKTGNKKGFSLLELMVAAVVLSILIATSGISLVHVARRRNIYRVKSAALMLASSKLEEAYGLIHQMTFSAAGLNSGCLDDDMTLGPNPGLTWTYDGVPYNRILAVTNDGTYAFILSRVFYDNTLMLSIDFNAKKYLE